MDQDRALARRKLARAAARLNVANGMAGRLPPLALMTDDARLEDPLAAARALPRGSLVVVRARASKARETLALAMIAVARMRDLIVLIAADPDLVGKSGADGLHLPEARVGEIAHWRARLPRSLITVSAHSLGAVARAREADAIFLSPVFPTRSHPGRASLTPIRANAIAQMSRVPAYALGGVTAENAGLLGTPFIGIAAIGALTA
jgi:thiamine-phosphate pyrophosphorylase